MNVDRSDNRERRQISLNYITQDRRCVAGGLSVAMANRWRWISITTGLTIPAGGFIVFYADNDPSGPAAPTLG
jgi:hypothetical protein